MNGEREAGSAESPRGRKRVRSKRALAQAATRPRRGLWAWLCETYATVDPRSLGVFRILFAIVLFHDVARRWPDLADHYSNAGWLTNHFVLFRPMSNYMFSLYLAFSTPTEVHVLAALHLLVNFLLLIGWRTRLMQLLAFLLIVSLNSRNIMLENGGFVVVHLIALWTLFLPLGRRFSVDALLYSFRQRREGTLETLNDPSEPSPRTSPVVSFAVTAVILQFAFIYYFNVVHKTGDAWTNGSAVYYFFEQDRMVTALGAWARHHVPIDLVRLLTWSTLITESLIAVCLISPVYTRRARMVGWALVFSLHLSIDAVVQLGPFSYAMFVIHAIFIPTEFWDFWRRRTLRNHAPSVLWLDPKSALELWVARLVKRLLPIGSVQFRDRATLEGESARDSGARGQLEVTVGSALPTLRGGRALMALAAPSWPLRIGLFWLRIPLCQRWVDRALVRAFDRDDARARPWGLAEPGAGDDTEAPPSRRSLAMAKLGYAVNNLVLFGFAVACGSQLLMENRAVPEALKLKKRPEWMTAMVVYPRLFQGWSMFAPDPPRDDGKIVVEGRTKDGRRFDPLSQGTPDYELNPPGGFEMNQLWGDFHRRIWQQRFRVYWNGFRDYLRTHHELTGHPENELVAFEVYYISELVPAPGEQRTPPKKEQLFTWGNMRRFEKASPHDSTP